MIFFTLLHVKAELLFDKIEFDMTLNSSVKEQLHIDQPSHTNRNSLFFSHFSHSLCIYIYTHGMSRDNPDLKEKERKRREIWEREREREREKREKERDMNACLCAREREREVVKYFPTEVINIRGLVNILKEFI